MRIFIPPLDLFYEDEKIFLEEKEIYPIKRLVKDLKNVLMDQEISEEESGNKLAYLIFRDICRKEDEKIFQKYKIRFDLTILFSRFLKNEYNKTFGHLHPVAEKSLTYPEIYEVIRGKALFILQHFITKQKIDKVIVIKAKKNDKVLIPPNYGHTTVNIGKRDLILVNLVSRKFSSIYDFYREKRGACIYVIKKNIKKENTEILFKSLRENFVIIKNPIYTEKFELNFFSRNKKPFKFITRKNLYLSFIKSPEKFNFLNKPSLLSI